MHPSQGVSPTKSVIHSLLYIQQPLAIYPKDDSSSMQEVTHLPIPVLPRILPGMMPSSKPAVSSYYHPWSPLILALKRTSMLSGRPFFKPIPFPISLMGDLFSKARRATILLKIVLFHQ